MLERWSLRREWSSRDLVRVPGLLSLSRFGLAAAFPFVATRPPLALAVLVLAGVSDVVDGWYARHFHEETPTGAAVDALADKVFVLTVVASLWATRALTGVEILLLGARDIGELALALRLHLGGRKVTHERAILAGKLATVAQYAAIVVAIVANAHRTPFVGAAALTGVVASIAYWNRALARA